ncbi:MAG TPA: DUF99 family protein [Candidatus Dormibacteraeota bacterium]|nr:DUF99 family protein [Candidatus Dormibacteraeota bacterium]
MPRIISRGDFSDTFQNRFRSSSRRLHRIVGVDGGAVSGGRQGRTVLVAALLEGPRIIDVRLGEIEVDGRDAQRVLLSLLSTLSYDFVMLSGVSFGGFNLVDIKLLARKVGKSVIAVIREKPDNKAVRDALRKHFDDWKQRWRAVKDAGRLYSCKPLVDEPKLYFEVGGGSPALAKKVIIASSTISRLPEPVRVAGILARGLRG